MVYEPSIYATFGTAIHETIQSWLDKVYNESVRAANELDLDQILLDNLRKTYIATKKQTNKEYSSPQELTEFYEDGKAILGYIVKHRLALLPSTKDTYLVGCEVPIFVELQEGFYFKGFIDILTYDTSRDVWKIWDLKSSTRGWKDEKADFIKTSQVLLYKEFLHRQFDIPLDKIEVEYFIVKRKIIEDAEFAAMRKRVQEFVPNDGPRIHKKVVGQIDAFLSEALDSTGEYLDKDYKKLPSTKNCRYCPYKSTCLGASSVL